MTKRRFLAAMIGSILAVVLITSASADITATTGEAHKGPAPNSVVLGQHEHDDDTGNPSGAHAFNEEQDYVTKALIALDVCTTATSAFVTCPNPRGGQIDDTGDLRPGTIPPNTCIDSHMLHADPPGLGPTGGLIYTGTVSFDSPILGVILLGTNLIASDADPGLAPTTTYGAEANRGLELDAHSDEITLNLTANRVQFRFDTRAGDLDQIRVITLGDPAKCPGQAKTLTLTPDAASNQVNTTHCVVATVKTDTGGPAQGIIVRFDVEGASELDATPPDEDASKTTDQHGVAEHCYSGPETVGIDRIHAYADNDRDGVEDLPTDPSDDATKEWLPAEGHSVTLDPKGKENPVNTRHCVSATVRDIFLNPVPNETVRFVVTRATATTTITTQEGVDQTDEFGVAEFCYTSTKAGADVITAYVDQDNDRTKDAEEPFDLASKVWQPGAPATVSLDPKAASNEVNTTHCVTATVRDAFQNPVPKVTVRFVVVGVNTRFGSDVTDEGGQADFCYSGTRAGADEITAYADSDGDKIQDAAEAADFAAKTWLPAEPAFLTLTPKAAENPVTNRPEGAHCVQAHVTDIFLNPNPNETVHFIVTDALTGTVEKQGSDVTDEGGIAEFCYTDTKAGLDLIHAFVDSIDPPLGESGKQDEGEPFDDATKLWQPGDPATLDLKPETSVNEVDTRHCVKAEVRDAFGNPTPDETVHFDVKGASDPGDANPDDIDGSDTTDEGGNVEFCYTGPPLPGKDTIHAYADNNENDVRDTEETAYDTATKTWIFPASTPGCEITMHDGGWILTAAGNKGTFGGNARIESDGTIITRGQLEYHDHNPLLPINFHSLQVVAIVCPSDGGGPRADVYGTGEINGVGPVDFRIRVRDLAEPGSQPAGPDTYQIITAAYTSGPEENPLQGGNIQIHRFS